MMKPNASAIAAAINNAEHGGWIDPSIVPLTWHCEFGRHGKNGKRPLPLPFGPSSSPRAPRCRMASHPASRPK
jgi:hypothetical protein